MLSPIFKAATTATGKTRVIILGFHHQVLLPWMNIYICQGWQLVVLHTWQQLRYFRKKLCTSMRAYVRANVRACACVCACVFVCLCVCVSV